MRGDSPLSLLAAVLLAAASCAAPAPARPEATPLADLPLVIEVGPQCSAARFGALLRSTDYVYAWGDRFARLVEGAGPVQLVVVAQSVADLRARLETVRDRPVALVNYNPEQWEASHTPDSEIADLPAAVRQARELATSRSARLGFTTTVQILEQHGSAVAPLVDLVSIQLQRWQSDPPERLRAEAERLLAIVRRGDPDVPVFFQFSLTPPLFDVRQSATGEERRVVLRQDDGAKLELPMPPEEILRRIVAVADLADGIALISSHAACDEEVRLVELLRGR